MSRLRTLVLVLLSLLLPLRGLMAATMPCADAAPLAPATVLSAHATMAMDAASAAPAHHATAAGDTLPSPCHEATSEKDEADGVVGDDAAPGTCHACASSCCMASMIGSSALLPAPLPPVAAMFPALSPRVVAVPPRGLDRPPRSS